METITLQVFFHKGMECIGIFSGNNTSLNTIIQKKAGAKWSRTNKCWYVPCTEMNYGKLARSVHGKAILANGGLKQYLLNNKNQKKPVQDGIVDRTDQVWKLAIPVVQSKPVNKLSRENIEALQKFKQELILKGYSPSTLRTYTNEIVQFLYIIKNKPECEFSVARLKDYLQYCNTTLKLSKATLHSRINAFYPVGFKK
jgi:integrase/recombinase XerD